MSNGPDPGTPRPEFLTWAEAAARLNRSIRQVKRAVYERGELESALVGKERMVLRSSVEAFIAGKEAEGRMAAQATRARYEARRAMSVR